MAESERFLSGHRTTEEEKYKTYPWYYLCVSCVFAVNLYQKSQLFDVAINSTTHVNHTFFPGGVVYIIPQSVEILINLEYFWSILTMC